MEIVIGRFIKSLIRVLKLGDGSTFAGRFILNVDKNFLKKMLNKLDCLVLVSGTNGKTTTNNMISFVLSKKFDVITNPTGANLIYGIATSFFENMGKIGVFEVDEFHLIKILKLREPEFIVLTNIFRDQLDRYTEVDKIKTTWKLAFNSLKKTKFIGNGDDPSIVYVLMERNAEFYGLDLPYSRLNDFEGASDSIYCPFCRTRLTYEKMYYSHLGDFYCESCGFRNPLKLVSFKDIKTNGFKGIELDGIFLNLYGFYNVYNVLASILTLKQFHFENEEILYHLKEFRVPFSRGEKITYKDKEIVLVLVKNPVGFNEVLRSAYEEEFDLYLIAINDWTADGHDVSWLWDVDFENHIKCKRIITSGSRCYDMAIRLKYSGFDDIEIIENLKDAVNKALDSYYHKIIVIGTYTATLLIRKILSQYKIVKSKTY